MKNFKKHLLLLSKYIVSMMIIGAVILSCEKEEKELIPQEEDVDTIPQDLVDSLAVVADFNYTVEKLTVSFENMSEKAYSYYWNFGDKTTPLLLENPVHEFPRTGGYTVTLIASGLERRRDTIEKVIEVVRCDETINPNFILESPYKNYANWYKGQMHVHTTEKDEDGNLISGSPDANDPVDVMVETYRDLGYDFIAITDHWVYTLNPNVPGIVYITGEEVEANLDNTGVHANGFNITDTIPDGTLVEDMVAMTDVFVQLNHPTRSGVNFDNINISGEGLWAIEIANWYNKKPKDKELWDNQISQGKKIWCNAGDDMHGKSDAGHNATIVNSTDSTKENIIANLLEGNFYATEGGPDNFVDMDIEVNDKIITCSTTNGTKILWYKHDMILVKETSGTNDSYTPVGNEVLIRIEVQMEGSDDDNDGVPNTAYSQPIFLSYQ